MYVLYKGWTVQRMGGGGLSGSDLSNYVLFNSFEIGLCAQKKKTKYSNLGEKNIVPTCASAGMDGVSSAAVSLQNGKWTRQLEDPPAFYLSAVA